jgi:hypothetical protein
MKYLLALSLMALMSIGLSAQELESVKCNWNDVELLPYSEGLQENEVTVSLGNILSDVKINSYEDLTDKQIKKIKKHARKFKSCKIYVDYDLIWHDKELNPELTENHLYFLCVLQEKENVL